MRTALSLRRVPMSVGGVLAVVATGPFLAPAASAVAPVAAVAATAPAALAAAPIQVPFLASGGSLIGAGTTGFLTRDADKAVRWTRYADGVSTVIGEGATVHGSASDSVVVSWEKTQRYGTEKAVVYDMATGAAPVTFDGFSGLVTGAAGSALFDDGGHLHPVLNTQQGSVRTSGQVVGMTEPSESEFRISDSLPGTALGYYRSFEPVKPEKLVVVDIAGARVTDTYTAGAGATFAGGASITADRVDWAEYVDGKTVLASATRGSAEVTRVPLTGDGPAAYRGALGGGWFVFDGSGDSPAPRGIVARSLTDETSFKLLDHAESVTKAADGTWLAIGTTADRGTGVYRLAVKDGKPSAELIAATGEAPAPTTPIGYTGHAIPATLSLDGVAKTRLSWKFSTTEADLSIELRHKESWRSFHTTVRPRATGTGVFPDGSLGIDWAGELGSGAYRSAAPGGAYEWTVTARPWNGMPSVEASGTFEVTRTPKAHDYTANGSPDLFARGTDGTLGAIDTLWDDATGRLVAAETRHGAVWPGDWNTYDRVEAVGDIAGSTVFDTVARDKAGVLWLHVGDPSVSTSPVRIGGGWNTYTRFTGGSDLTGDGRADLVAVDTVGDLYLYTATGSTTVPFAPRKKIGYGWGIFNQITATGQIGGNPTGDLVARDKDGVLWTYLGKGDGTFAPRTTIGGGWNVYADLVGIGDGNKDGRPDLYARTAAGAAYFYAGTGDYKTPFKPRASTEAGTAASWAGEPYRQVS
ncbi:FG-GAP repeat domain-containing protein [Streptomyces sp. NPDC059352]|uniref:FG-GAP repeat domain-containing protein n=1 Tax=Streptomyces sp. NPDC059352 TaxID=3346810 RepID=UPI0036B3A4DD